MNQLLMIIIVLCILKILLLLIHSDGTITMQSISLSSLEDSNREKLIKTQEQHCNNLKLLHKRLKENWFISYDYDENNPPNSIYTLEEWKDSRDNQWFKHANSNEQAEMDESLENISNTQNTKYKYID